MGHRALLAVSRDGGEYAVSLAPQGAADWLVEPLLRPGATVPPSAVDGPELGRATSVEAVVEEHLDPTTHEALVVVDRDGSPTPYAVIPLVLATADGLVEGDPRAVLLGLVGRGGSVLGQGYVRGWLHGTAGVLGEAVDVGVLGPEQALGWFRGAVGRLAGSRHEVKLVPPVR